MRRAPTSCRGRKAGVPTAPAARPRIKLDRFSIAIVGAIIVASLLPCRGRSAEGFAAATQLAIAALFFFHGARLAPQAVRAGIQHWRLHLLILFCTFGMFPLLGLALQPLSAALLPPSLRTGLLFLCLVPSTVQSSIAFTALARGNVAAAVCSASASSLLGIVLTPALARLTGLTGGGASHSGSAALGIVLQLLLPFLAGQLMRPLLVHWVERHGAKLRLLDQGSILLVIYSAFSGAVVQHAWSQIPVYSMLSLVPLTALLLAAALLITWQASELLGFDERDRIAILFCGSKKSLASGVPFASVLFPAHAVSVMVLPLVLFHQIQLLVCALLAQRHASRAPAVGPGEQTLV